MNKSMSEHMYFSEKFHLIFFASSNLYTVEILLNAFIYQNCPI